MRRLSGLIGLLLFLAPAGLRLATAGDDSPAMRCAIACGHASGATKGAACCPMSEAPGSGPVLKTCTLGGDTAIAPLVPAPFLLAFVERLPAPDGSRLLDAGESSAVRVAFLRAPEKVPLLA